MDKRVIVTGGSSGMGEATVLTLARRGARVVSLDIAQDSGVRIADKAGACFVRCDVTDEESVRSAFARAVGHLGGLDALVHAAGIAPGHRPRKPRRTCGTRSWMSTRREPF